MAWFREHFGSRWVTVAAIALSVYLTLAGSDGAYPWSPFPRPLAVAAGLIGSLALWWWSTRPVEVAAVNVAAVALSANPVPAVVALYTLAASRRAALPLAAISGAAVVAFAVPEWVDAGKLSVSPLVGGFFATWWRWAPASMSAPPRPGPVAARPGRGGRGRASCGPSRRNWPSGPASPGRCTTSPAHKVAAASPSRGALEVNPGAGTARVEEVLGRHPCHRGPGAGGAAGGTGPAARRRRCR